MASCSFGCMLHRSARRALEQCFWRSNRKLVLELNPQYVFTPEQVELRNSIGEKLHQIGLNQPIAAQLMLANFLLSPPGLLTINNIDQFFQPWLRSAYQELYLDRNNSLPAAEQQTVTTPPLSDVPPALIFGPFPSILAGTRVE